MNMIVIKGKGGYPAGLKVFLAGLKSYPQA
jgi:hypothetical protein